MSSLDLETRNTTRFGLLGSDFRGTGLELLCEVDDSVQAGTAVMRDARRPQICITAPGPGRVRQVERGARRKLLSLQFEADDSLGVKEFDVPGGQDRDSQRAFMLASGAWTYLHTRPFGNIPDPDAEPAALFVTVIDEQPLAPPVATVIEAFSDEFRAGVEMLTRISKAPVYVCQAPSYRPPLEPASSAQGKSFVGGQAAGLPGRHIQALCPVGFAGGEVWHIGYQQVIALGHLLVQGRPWLQRVVSIGGDAITRPRCLLVPVAAAIDELLAGETTGESLRVLNGSTIFGRELADGQAYLASDQRQITVQQRSGINEGKPAGALIPGDWLEALAPPGIYPVPLMRALQLGDAERARQLGALELVEEDLVPLSRACVSNNDYALLLRRVLDQLEALR